MRKRVYALFPGYIASFLNNWGKAPLYRESAGKISAHLLAWCIGLLVIMSGAFP